MDSKAKDPADTLKRGALAAQRNVVYPDTISNEFRGYQRLLSAPTLSAREKIGAGLIGLAMLPAGLLIMFSSILVPRMAVSGTHSFAFGVLMIPLGLLIACIGIAFAIFGFRLLVRAFGG